MPSEMMQAGAPFSVGKFSAYSASNSDHGISWAIFTQRLSDDNLPPKGSSNSDGGLRQAQLLCTLSHWVMQGFCTILTVYLAHFSRSHDRITTPCNLSALIQQALFMDGFPQWNQVTDLGNLAVLWRVGRFRRCGC
jgi:hypothetical protein